MSTTTLQTASAQFSHDLPPVLMAPTGRSGSPECGRPIACRGKRASGSKAPFDAMQAKALRMRTKAEAVAVCLKSYV